MPRLDFLKSLKGEAVEVDAERASTVGCDALRAGEQTINLVGRSGTRGALLAKAKVDARRGRGGLDQRACIEMDRTIRFAAADWRDGDKINRDKIASAVCRRAEPRRLRQSRSRTAGTRTPESCKLTFKRPNQVLSGTRAHRERSRLQALISPDKPGTTDKLMLWISEPVDHDRG